MKANLGDETAERVVWQSGLHHHRDEAQQGQQSLDALWTRPARTRLQLETTLAAALQCPELHRTGEEEEEEEDRRRKVKKHYVIIFSLYSSTHTHTVSAPHSKLGPVCVKAVWEEAGLEVLHVLDVCYAAGTDQLQVAPVALPQRQPVELSRETPFSWSEVLWIQGQFSEPLVPP